MNNISLEVIEYFEVNVLNKENIEDFSLYLYGIGAIEYRLENNCKVYGRCVVPTCYPKTLEEALQYFPKKVSL